MSKYETRNTFYWITWEVNTVCWVNLASLCNITKENLEKFKKFYERRRLGTSSRPFLIFKESSVKRNMRRSVCWFGQILIVLKYISNINSLLQKFHFPIDLVLKPLQTQTFSWNFLIFFFFFNFFFNIT